MEVHMNESICKSELHGKLFEGILYGVLVRLTRNPFYYNRLFAKVKLLLVISSILGVPTPLEFFPNITNGQSGTKISTET
jgi:hypothetical protein